MSQGLKTTFTVLQKSRNESALRLLIAALDSTDSSIQYHAFRALLERRDTAGKWDVLTRWHTLSDRWKKLVAESSGRISGAIRAALLSDDRQLVSNGCEAVLVTREYEAVTTLLSLAEDRHRPSWQQATETVLALVEALNEELQNTSDYRQRRNRRLIRKQLVVELEQSARRYDVHKNRQIIEAFLMLAERDCPWLNHVLQNMHHAAFAATMHVLSTSPRPTIIKLALSYLDAANAPSSAISVLARRGDLAFVRHLTKRAADRIPEAARRALRKVDSFRWLREDLTLLSALDDGEQHGALQLALASNMSRRDILEVLRFMMTSGGVGSRRTAISKLRGFHGQESDQLVAQALNDVDAFVQAEAVQILAERNPPGTVSALLPLLHSPHEAVREAARKPLAEFTFSHYQPLFDSLDECARRKTGELVKRVDPSALPQLRAMLRSSQRRSKLKALEMAAAMQATCDLEGEVIACLRDTDHLVRAAAAEVLSQSDSAESREALQQALSDAMASVAEAAEESLRLRSKLTRADLPWHLTANDNLPLSAEHIVR